MDRYSFAAGDTHPLPLTDFSAIYHNIHYAKYACSSQVVMSCFG